MIRHVAPSRPDAIIVMCTNFRGSPVASALTEELQISVIDSVRAPVLDLVGQLSGPEENKG
ncbi:MAG TPA: hypothetical protein VHX12_14495 [Acidisoma sp.]|nr:hypothetical protein [Acidisoma sp.]